ncbi:ScbR family autoregulator-binding transcription factor [Streptacidiphilus albus]|uniref:ScbR family autoregulator-binding transcription factor n=1 Tax=Streptacidiphilus albus TaxID=105425 RepID=UPI000B200C34
MVGEPKQERAIQTRALLLRAAAEVFDEYGYDGASVSKILARAGVTPGAMYFHFKNKEALAEAVINAQPETIVPHLESEGLQRLVDITMVWSKQLQVDPVLRAGVRLVVERSTFGEHDASSYLDWAQIMTGVLDEAVRKGELQAGVRPEEVAQFVVGACTGIQLFAEAATRRSDLPERAVRMWRLLLPGIAVPAVLARTRVDPDLFTVLGGAR